MKEAPNKSKKSPTLAAFLSIIPGAGSLYLGNIFKAIVNAVIFIVLVVLAAQTPYAGDSWIFVVLIASFYIYQIIDCYDEANSKKRFDSKSISAESGRPVSLFWAIMLVLVGILFQLANFELFDYRDIVKFWPLLLIVLGVKILVAYFKKEERGETGKD